MTETQNQTSGIETHGFLGQEFLTWLWFRWETEGGEFALPGGRVVGIAIDDFLAFAAPSDDETEQTLKHGLPTRTEEARTGLRQGRRLGKARLLIAEGERQWSVVFDGASMSLGSARLPEDDEESESDQERTADRAANWLTLQEIITQLYGQFLRLRLAPNYMDEVGEQQAQWMQK